MIVEMLPRFAVEALRVIPVDLGGIDASGLST
jgi:hypothetical protein